MLERAVATEKVDEAKALEMFKKVEGLSLSHSAGSRVRE